MTTKTLKTTTRRKVKRLKTGDSEKVIKTNLQSSPNTRLKNFQTVQDTPMLDQNVSFTDVGAGVTYYYNQDERQSVRNLTNTSGSVDTAYDYTAYGDKVKTTLTPLNLPTLAPAQRYQYTGRELNDASGNYYFRYRMYGAYLGGFMSRDPLGYIDGRSVYSGWFAYGMGVDPYGTSVTDDIIKKIKGINWENSSRAEIEAMKLTIAELNEGSERQGTRTICPPSCLFMCPPDDLAPAFR